MGLLATPFGIINLSFSNWPSQPAASLAMYVAIAEWFCSFWVSGSARSSAVRRACPALWDEVRWPSAGAHPRPSCFLSPGPCAPLCPQAALLTGAWWVTGPRGAAAAVGLRWAGFPTGQLPPQGRVGQGGRTQTAALLHRVLPQLKRCFKQKACVLPPISAFGNTLVLILNKTVV